jgi:hypothetical protein
MKLKYLLIIGVASILTFGCAREAAVNQPSTDAMSPASNPVTTVNSPTNSAESSAQKAVKSGTFVAGEKPTQGTARIVTEGGKRYLELDRAFKTDKGPDLFVILHRSDTPKTYDAQEYVNLGRLQKLNGPQRYAIPESVDIEDFRSAAIWCRQFNVGFGHAQLSS